MATAEEIALATGLIDRMRVEAAADVLKHILAHADPEERARSFLKVVVQIKTQSRGEVVAELERLRDAPNAPTVGRELLDQVVAHLRAEP